MKTHLQTPPCLEGANMQNPKTAGPTGPGLSGSLTIEWLTTEEAATYLRVSVGALRNMTSNGKVPYHKLDRRNRYLLTELRELLLKNKRGGSYGN